MQVSIVFSTPVRFWREFLEISPGTSVIQAVRQSSFASEFPEYTDHMPAMGVYGVLCDGDRILQDNDRIELYRPLVFDPQQTRRRRAEHKKSGG